MTHSVDVRAEDDLAGLANLANVAGRMRRGSRLIVTVGAPVVRVKQIVGISVAGGERAASRRIRENTATYFLRAADRIELADAALTRDGQVWAAAYDRGVLEEIADCVRGARCRLVCVAPRPELFPESLQLRKRWYRHRPLAWYPRRPAESTRRIRMALVSVSVGMAVFSVLAAFAAPVVRHHRFMQAHFREAQRAQSILAAASRVRAETARTSRQLADILAFSDARPTVPRLLSSVSEALPESTAVVAIHLDSREGSIAAITASAASLLAALDSVNGLVAPRVSGALTSEIVAGARFQRTTVRFRRKPGGGA